MAVTIVRNTGIYGSATGMTVKVNGEKVTKIKKQAKVDIPEVKTTISVSQFGETSNKIKVKDGQKITITTRSWSKISIIAFVVIVSVANTVLDSNQFPAVFIVTIIFVIMQFTIDRFRLQIAETENQSGCKRIN